jgi:hypothetical protein
LAVLVDKLVFSGVYPPIWRFWWTSCRFPGFVHRFGVFGGQVAVLWDLSTDLAFLVDKGSGGSLFVSYLMLHLAVCCVY